MKELRLNMTSKMVLTSAFLEAIDKLGSQTAIANKLGVSRQFVGQVYHRCRPPSKPMLKLLGIEMKKPTASSYLFSRASLTKNNQVA